MICERHWQRPAHAACNARGNRSGCAAERVAQCVPVGVVYRRRVDRHALAHFYGCGAQTRLCCGLLPIHLKRYSRPFEIIRVRAAIVDAIRIVPGGDRCRHESNIKRFGIIPHGRFTAAERIACAVPCVERGFNAALRGGVVDVYRFGGRCAVARLSGRRGELYAVDDLALERCKARKIQYAGAHTCAVPLALRGGALAFPTPLTVIIVKLGFIAVFAHQSSPSNSRSNVSASAL